MIVFFGGIFPWLIFSSDWHVSTDEKQQGLCWGHGKTAFWNHYQNYSSSASRSSIDAAAALGANWIQIETAWYQDQCKSTHLHSEVYTPSDAVLVDAIKYVHQSNMLVMLNAHIEVSCKYYGNCSDNCKSRNGIDFGSNTTGWNAWFATYTQFIIHYAKLCEVNDVEMLTVYVELQNIPAKDSYWRDVIRAVRKVYSGSLIASVNGGNPEGITDILYWDALDYIGIDSFPYLGKQKTIDVVTVKQKFDSLLVEFTKVAKSFNRSIIFTQIGYASCDSCGDKNAPSKYPHVNEQCQCNAYLGMFESLWNSDVVAGLYWWNRINCIDSSDKYCQIGSKDNHMSPQKKGVQDIIAYYYGGESNIGTCQWKPPTLQ